VVARHSSTVICRKITDSQGSTQITGSFSGVSTKADLIRGLSAVIVRCTSIPAPIPRCSAFAGGLAAAPLVAGAVLGAGGQGLSEIGAAKQSNTGVVSRAAASLLSRLFFSASTPRVLRRETQTSPPLP
jgi:hypothetical protein